MATCRRRPEVYLAFLQVLLTRCPLFPGLLPTQLDRAFSSLLFPAKRTALPINVCSFWLVVPPALEVEAFGSRVNAGFE
jgi:hypothetical protein